MNKIYITIYCLATILLFLGNTSDENCKRIYIQSRSITLGDLFNIKTPNKNKIVGFISDKARIFSAQELAQITNKYQIPSAKKCIEVILKEDTLNQYRKDEITQIINVVNEYFKRKKELVRAKTITILEGSLPSEIKSNGISLRKIENGIYELKFLNNNKEEKLKIEMSLFTPTFFAKTTLPPDSIIRRKFLSLKYLPVDDSNFTLKDWKSITSPIFTRSFIKKGEIIKKDNLMITKTFPTQIVAEFDCKNFSIMRTLTLKKVEKEWIELEDKQTKKSYKGLPIGLNKAKIMCDKVGGK
jgi:hypothetical protein